MDNEASGGTKKKTTELDPKLSLMNEIEFMISKSVKNVFETEIRQTMDALSKQQQSEIAKMQKTISEIKNNHANKQFELPNERQPIKAGPYDIFSENSTFSKRNDLLGEPNASDARGFNETFSNRNEFRHEQGTPKTRIANSYNSQRGASHHEQGAPNAQIDANALILNFLEGLQGDREERNERKFERELNKIPEFSGDSKKNLDRFVTASSIAYSKIRSQQQNNSFYDEILRKTSGSALATVESMVGHSWNDIEGALRRRFAYLTVNPDVLRSKIEALRQNKTENIHDFAKRTRTLVNERIKSYDSISSDLEREIERAALKCFQRGISNEKIRERAINMGASTLDGAFQNALEIESELAFEVNKRDFYCKKCTTTGHKTSECRKNDQSEMARFTSALEKLAMVKSKRNDFKNQSNPIGKFSNNNDSKQNNWRKNGNQPNLDNTRGNGNKSIHAVHEQKGEIDKEEIEHDGTSDSDSSENSN